MSLPGNISLLARFKATPSGSFPVGTTGIAATQVAYGSGVNQIKGSATFTFTEAGGILALSGAGAAGGILRLPSGATQNFGIGFGADTFIYRAAAGQINLDSATDAQFTLVKSGTSRAAMFLAGNDLAVGTMAANAAMTLRTNNNLTAVTISTAQLIRFNAYGAGAITADASGNLTAVSDARKKDIVRPFTRGLSDVLKITPQTYKWKKDTGLDTEHEYTGFIAQDVQASIPEAVFADKDGMLSFSDRPVTCALINAVKELSARVGKLEKN